MHAGAETCYISVEDAYRQAAGKADQRPPGHAGTLTAADMMAPSLIPLRPEDSLAHAMRLMLQHRLKRLAVVDEAGHFRGMVDRREILRLLAGEAPMTR
jgi:CBS-domain-containing membrane protein